MQVVLFLLLFALYLLNLSRSVYGGDVGDLVTAAYTFGVPHPPGYPLFTLLGFLFTRFASFFQQTPAFMVGVISAFSSAGAVALYYAHTIRQTKNTVISLVSALTLAFTFLFWFYAEIAEVFALNNFFAVLLIVLAFLYREEKSRKYLYALSFVAGLSLTNHHTIIFIFPTVIILIWSRFFQDVKLVKARLLWCALFALAGFSIYGYAIIASLSHPLVDWAQITDLQSFLDLVLRERYGTFQLAVNNAVSPEARLVVLKAYAITLITQMTIPVVLFSLLGVVSLFKKSKTVALALLMGFIVSGPFFVVYAGFKLPNSFYFGIYERFLSLSVVILLFFFPYGVLSFTNFLTKFFSRKEYRYLFQGVFLLIPVMLFFYNFPKTNLSQVWLGDDLGKNYLSILPKDSILYLSGDTNLFNSLYMRYVRNFRTDTQLYNGLDTENTVKLYGMQFGKTQTKDFQFVVNELDKKRPIFSDIRFKGDELKGEWIPYGLYYEYRSVSEVKLSYTQYLERTEKIWNTMKISTAKQQEQLSSSNHTLAILPEMYTNALIVAGNYFISAFNREDTALSYYQKALKIDPEYSKTYATIGAFYLTNKRDCKAAIPYLKKAITLHKFDARYYYLLSIASSECKVAKDQIKQLEDDYKRVFQTPLTTSMKEYETDVK